MERLMIAIGDEVLEKPNSVDGRSHIIHTDRGPVWLTRYWAQGSEDIGIHRFVNDVIVLLKAEKFRVPVILGDAGIEPVQADTRQLLDRAVQLRKLRRSQSVRAAQARASRNETKVR